LRRIENGEGLLAVHYQFGDLVSTRNLNFLTTDNEFLQISTWNHPEGHETKAHKHNIYSREATRTSEAIFVICGAVRAKILNESGVIVETVLLEKLDLLYCRSGGHSYKILTSDTTVLEFKNGPFLGNELDKTVFSDG